MDYSVTAKEILEKVGGEKNVASVTHCMTRLRFILRDESLADDEKIKAIKGVAGVMKKAGQYQVIVGNEVAKCYKELVQLGNFSDAAEEKTVEKPKQNPVMALLDVITGCMSPIIPAIIGAGMIKVLIIILGLFLSPESQTMQLLTVMGDCAYYFLPMLIAYSAGKKLDFHNFLKQSYLILTDSGGIQEEAPGLGKPVLVMRDTTERPEGVEAGTLLLTGTTEEAIYRAFHLLLHDPVVYERMSHAVNPYGDGYASRRIADIVERGMDIMQPDLSHDGGIT